MKRYLPHLAVLLFAVGMHGAGYLSALENYLADSRFRLIRTPASGDVVVVEIDSASLRALDSWPWPRHYHARVVDGLIAAGARVVALDIDFSARSTEAGDTALAAALERAAGRVILPVFRQYASSGAGSQMVVNRPIEPFRPHARLAAINIYPDANGQVRQASLSETIDGTRLPTMTSALAGIVLPPADSFLIDFGIGPDGIPTLSYKDILSGRFTAGTVRGKAVIVGATALELGNRTATPLDPSTSGPMLRALAYESLVQDRALKGSGLSLVAIVAALLALVIGPRIAGMGWYNGALVAGGTMTGLYLVSVVVQATAPVALDVAPWLMVVAGSYGIGLVTQVEAFSRAAFRRRMEVEQNRAVIRSVVADSLDGVVIVDWTGRIHLINRAAADLLAVDADAAAGASAATVLPRLDLVPVEHGDGAILEALALLAEAPGPTERVVTVDGDDRDIELVVRRTVVSRASNRIERRAGDRDFFTLSLRDVSAQRETERAQRRAAELAVEANETKTLFLANMSHELRTPLNAILGFSELMTRQMFGPMTPTRYRDYAEDIHSSSRHLLSVLNDILDLAKVESGRQEVVSERFGIDEVFDECLRIVRGRNLHLRRIIEISLPTEPVIVLADRRLILQSILNLLTNAVKFSDPDTRIVLRGYREALGNAVIEVEDNGWGISPEDLKSVARPFYQAQTAKKADGAGTGLGLSLVAKYAELHGGSLNIESELGRGTLIRIVLPATVVEVPTSRVVGGEEG